MAQDPAVEELSKKKSKKKLIVILAAAIVLLGGGGGAAAWYFTQQKPDTHKKEAVEEAPPAAPVFLTLETFTVNLNPEAGEQYLQVDITLNTADQAEADLIKLHMPQVRNRVLMLLTSKKASDISTVEGKKALSEEIARQINEPFTPKAKPQKVSGVFFTSFVIQ